MTVAVRPDSAEVPASYAGYVGKVRDGEDLMGLMEGQLEEVRSAFGRFPEARGSYRYAPGKWSVKELLGHLSDTERIFCYRALRFARGDATPLPGFDENAYAPEMRADSGRWPSCWRSGSTSGGPPSRASEAFRPTPGPAEVSPAARRSACGHWPTPSPATPAIISRCWPSGIGEQRPETRRPARRRAVVVSGRGRLSRARSGRSARSGTRAERRPR